MEKTLAQKEPEIEMKLLAIFKNRSGRDFREEGLRDKKLLGIEIAMPARELLYIYFDIEKSFGIQIPDEILLCGNFDTFHHICDAVKNTLKG